jgi:hypothetical protein
MIADVRARLVAGWESASNSDQTIEQVDDPRVPPGWSMWRLGFSATVLPALVAHAPRGIHLRYRLRVLADLTGRCHACGAVASIDLAMAHEDGCPTQFSETDRGWFDPRAVAPHEGSQEDA